MLWLWLWGGKSRKTKMLNLCHVSWRRLWPSAVWLILAHKCNLERFFFFVVVVENISCVQRNTSLCNLVFLFPCEGHMLVFTLPAFIRLYLKSRPFSLHKQLSHRGKNDGILHSCRPTIHSDSSRLTLMSGGGLDVRGVTKPETTVQDCFSTFVSVKPLDGLMNVEEFSSISRQNVIFS